MGLKRGLAVVAVCLLFAEPAGQAAVVLDDTFEPA
jgi:hypothetical protein